MNMVGGASHTFSIVLVAIIIGWSCANFLFNENPKTPKQWSDLANNQSIVMVGDSLMRYQYLSLVHLVHFDKFVDYHVRPNILLVMTYDNWISYYRNSTELFGGSEHCDCYRGEHPKNFSDGFENRYYYNEKRNISITYIMYFGDMQQVQGHWLPELKDRDCFRTPSEYYIPPIWSYPTIQEALVNIVAKISPAPTVMLLNAGFHHNKYDDPAHAQSVAEIASIVAPRVMWKTTNGRVEPRQDELSETDKRMCAFDELECFNIGWSLSAHPSTYADNIHFMPQMYSLINMQFLRQLTENTPVLYKAMPNELRGSLISVAHSNPKMYKYVDHFGYLREVNPPANFQSEAACEALNKRVAADTVAKKLLIKSPKSLTNTLVGPPIEDLCAYLGVCSRFEGHVVQGKSSKSIYLVQNCTKREFQSGKAFIARGFSFKKIRFLTYRELVQLDRGAAMY